MRFPKWLEEKHELTGTTMYTTGSDHVYAVLSLTGKRVEYSTHGSGHTRNSREFPTRREAKRFYYEAAKIMRDCHKRNTIPLWHHLV